MNRTSIRFYRRNFGLRWVGAGLFLCLWLAACSPASPATVTTQSAVTAKPRILRVMTHDSFAISAEVLAAFETENNAKVQFVKSGDLGSALNKAILSRDNPLADVFYGVDNTFLSRALNEGIFEAYPSSLLASIPDEFKLDAEARVLPVDYGDVCLNYDKAYFAQKKLPPGSTLREERYCPVSAMPP